MPTVLNGVPGSFVAGDSLAWAEAWPDYDESAGWSMTTTFRLTDSTLHKVEGVGSGTDWTFTLNAPQSADWTPGAAEWFTVARNGQDRLQVRRGLIRVAPDPEQAVPQTDLERDIAFLETAVKSVERQISARLDKDKSDRYTVSGQSHDKVPLTDLMNTRKKLIVELRIKRSRRRRLASGLPSQRVSRVTFGG